MKHLGFIRVLLCLLLLLPRFVCAHHLLSITPVTPFPATVQVLSATTATYNITNFASKIFVTAINQSIFPCPSGMQIIASTCGTPMAPGQSCQLTLSFNAPSSAQVLHAELRAWAKPSADGVRYPFSINVVQPQQFTVTPNAGAHGSIAPATPQTVNIGASVTFTATPASGYVVNEWLVDGVSVQPGGTSFTLSNVTADHIVTVTFAVPTPVTVGLAFSSFLNDQIPVAYTSNDNGTNWLLSPTFTQPVGFPLGALNSVSCTGPLCVAVGQSGNVGLSTIVPAAYKSIDGGRNWSAPAPTFNLPLGKAKGLLASTACVGNTCVAVGNAYNLFDRVPLSYTSIDGGSTWTLGPTFNLPPTKTIGDLSGVDCVGAVCTAVGNASTNLGELLATAYTSNDSGLTWTLSSTTILPPGNTLSQLFDVSCVSTICTAVGLSDDTPIAYTSNDSGQSWSESATITCPGASCTLNGVRCIATHCVAVGRSTDGGGVQTPVAYTSEDNGQTWSAPITTFVLPGLQTNGILTSLSCVGAHCITTGYSFASSSTNLPLAYTSSDGGLTWSAPSPTLNLPGSLTQGILLGTSNSSGSGLLPLNQAAMWPTMNL